MIDAVGALSLRDLERHDPTPSGRGVERRFLCPFPACADHQRKEHKNLAANIETGAWHCCRCDARGKFVEKWEPRERSTPRATARRVFGLSTAHQTATQPQEASQPDQLMKLPAWRRRWDQSTPVDGTPGADYLRSRGIPTEVVGAAKVRYVDRWSHWSRTDSDWVLDGTSRRVVFPLLDQGGQLVGIQARAIDAEHLGEKVVSNGSAGVFHAAPDALDSERVAIAEAPCDALSLVVLGVLAISTQGTSWPAWLPKVLAFKHVLLAHDNDEPGEDAATRWANELAQWGARTERMRPTYKDWNQDLQTPGPNWKPWLNPVESARRVWYPGTCRWCGRPMHDADYVCWRPEELQGLN